MGRGQVSLGWALSVKSPLTTAARVPRSRWGRLGKCPKSLRGRRGLRSPTSASSVTTTWREVPVIKRTAQPSSLGYAPRGTTSCPTSPQDLRSPSSKASPGCPRVAPEGCLLPPSTRTRSYASSSRATSVPRTYARVIRRGCSSSSPRRSSPESTRGRRVAPTVVRPSAADSEWHGSLRRRTEKRISRIVEQKAFSVIPDLYSLPSLNPSSVKNYNPSCVSKSETINNS